MGIAVLYSDDQENVGFYTYRAISCIKIRRIVMYLSISIPKMALHANEGSVRIFFGNICLQGFISDELLLTTTGRSFNTPR